MSFFNTRTTKISTADLRTILQPNFYENYLTYIYDLNFHGIYLNYIMKNTWFTSKAVHSFPLN